jgi:hypothetical protein
MKDAIESNVASFLKEYIFSRFGYPRRIVTDQGTQFTPRLVGEIMMEHNIRHGNSTPYHPQENEQVEVKNRELENILTKIMIMNKKHWSKKLIEEAWEYNITWKTTTWITPFELVYGNKSMLSIEFEYHTLRTTVELNMNLQSAQKERLIQLNVLDEYKMQALFNTEVVQQQIKS